MAKYVYPAIFAKEDNGYSVTFPDVSGCYTQGRDLCEAMEMAQDALCLMMYSCEEDGLEIRAASDIRSVKAQDDEIVSLVSCDTIEYRKFYDNRAVKKTLTIPSWLNTMAEKKGLNFSQALQQGLKEQLNIE